MSLVLTLRVCGIGGVVCELSADREWTVAWLKKLIRGDVPVRDKRLFYNTREIKNTERLSSIFAGSIVCADLTLILRPPGEADWLVRVRGDWRLLQNAPEEIKQNRGVIRVAISRDAQALAFASEEIRADQEIALQVIKQSSTKAQLLNTLRNIAPALLHCKVVILLAISQNVAALLHVPEELRADQEVALAAISGSSSRGELKTTMGYIAPTLLGKRDFMLAVLGTKASDDMKATLFKFASSELQADSSFRLAALSSSPSLVRDVFVDCFESRDFLLSAVTQNSKVFNYLPAHIRNNDEFVRCLMMPVPGEPCEDQQLALAAISRCWSNDQLKLILGYIAPTLFRNHEFMLGVLVTVLTAGHCAGHEDMNTTAAQFATQELWENPIFIQEALSLWPKYVRERNIIAEDQGTREEGCWRSCTGPKSGMPAAVISRLRQITLPGTLGDRGSRRCRAAPPMYPVGWRLVPGDPKFDELNSQFKNKWSTDLISHARTTTCNCPTIKEIYAVSNPILEAAHAACAASIGHVPKAGNGEDPGNQQQRFHQTTMMCDFNGIPCDDPGCAVCSIITTGFQMKLVGDGLGSRFGAGLYSASSPSKSHQYGNKKGMFVVSVACGVVDASKKQTPPPVVWHSRIVNAGVSGDALTIYDELFVFDDAAMIPRYLMMFEK